MTDAPNTFDTREAQPVSTALEELTALAAQLESALSDVLDHSEIYEAIRNTPDDPVVFIGNPYAWRAFPRKHQPIFGAARQVLGAWEALAGAAVRGAAPNRLDAFTKHGEILREAVDQEDGRAAPNGTIVGVRNQVAKALKQQREMLAELPSAHGPSALLVVPDTNSIIFQPALDEWKPSEDDWTAVLVPQVIRELDELKQRDKPVAAAAQSFIRRLDEYGRRGDTFEGVAVSPGLRLREVPIEADMATAPPWLRAGHADDQLLASVLELKWSDLNGRVLLVTRDRNLKNKARLSRVAYVDVETIAKPRPRRQPRTSQPSREQVETAPPAADGRTSLGPVEAWRPTGLSVDGPVEAVVDRARNAGYLRRRRLPRAGSRPRSS